MSTVINIRTDKNIRNKARKVFYGMGISTSAGINMFLHQVVTEKGLPFIPTTDLTRVRERWDAQVEHALSSKKYDNARDALRGL